MDVAAAVAALFQGADESRAMETLRSTRPAYRGTTQISIVDGDGRFALATVSNGEGAGFVVPGSGVVMNNMLGEDDINPAGFHQWPTDVRLSSMMAPTLVQRRDGGFLGLGSGGSSRIRTAILQVLISRLVCGLDLDQAVAAPRMHIEGDLLNIEQGFPAEAQAGLSGLVSNVRAWAEPSMFFGGVHAVEIDADGKMEAAAGDPRRAGVAIKMT